MNMKLPIAIISIACFCTGCATSTVGLSKDQITEQQRQRAAWADFGRSVLTIAVNAGVASFGNSGREDGFRK